MDTTILVDAVLFGTILSAVLQGIRMLPKHWVVKLFGSNKATRKERMQAFVFVASFVYVLIQAAIQDMFHVANVDELVALLALSLTTSYSMYKTAIKRVSERFTNA